MLILLSVFNAATIINRFTRVAGELFGMLITVLFIQEAIKVPILYNFIYLGNNRYSLSLDPSESSYAWACLDYDLGHLTKNLSTLNRITCNIKKCSQVASMYMQM